MSLLTVKYKISHNKSFLFVGLNVIVCILSVFYRRKTLLEMRPRKFIIAMSREYQHYFESSSITPSRLLHTYILHIHKNINRSVNQQDEGSVWLLAEREQRKCWAIVEREWESWAVAKRTSLRSEMKIECQKDRHCDSLSSWRSQKIR